MLTTMLCLLYAAGCFGAALFFVGRLKGVDRSAQVPTPPVPSTLDPLEIAYLRGGRGDVLRATLVGLEANSQVRVTSDNKFERTALTLPGSNPVETAVLDALTAQKTFSEVARA